MDIFTSITRHGFADGPEIELDASRGYVFLNKVSLFGGKLPVFTQLSHIPFALSSVSCVEGLISFFLFLKM